MTDKPAMKSVLDDYDWKEVFAFAGEALTADAETSSYLYSNTMDIRTAPPGVTMDVQPFSRNDVAELVWIEEGANDEADWLIGGTLADGRWFFITAGCDYTGWGCQSGGACYVATTREDIERYAMGNPERDRLNVAPIDGEHRTDSAGW